MNGKSSKPRTTLPAVRVWSFKTEAIRYSPLEFESSSQKVNRIDLQLSGLKARTLPCCSSSAQVPLRRHGNLHRRHPRAVLRFIQIGGIRRRVAVLFENADFSVQPSAWPPIMWHAGLELCPSPEKRAHQRTLRTGLLALYGIQMEMR